jgi:hypothetical protein
LPLGDIQALQKEAVPHRRYSTSVPRAQQEAEKV